MDIKTEKQKASRVIATVTFTAEERKAAEDAAFNAIAGQVKLKGFRPGKAPADMIKTQISGEDVMQEMIRQAMPQAVTKAMEESKVKPVIRPSANIKSVDPLVITLTFVERPEVKLKKPDNIAVEKKEIADATDVEVDRFIKNLLTQDRTEKPVEREARQGDAVRISMKAMEGKTEVAELTVPQYSLVIGSEDLLPELEAPILGMKKDDVKDAVISFKKDHDIPAIRGKKITITITMKSVSETVLPELNAEYLKTRLRTETTPELFRTDVRRMLTDRKKSEEMQRREQELYEKVRTATQVDLAQELVDVDVADMVEDLERRMKEQKVSVEEWLKQTNRKWEDVIKEMRDIASSRITLRYGMQALAEHLKLEPTAEQMKQGIEQAKASMKDRQISDEDTAPGGSIYEHVKFNEKMQVLVGKMIG